MNGWLWALLSAASFSTEGLLARLATGSGGAVPPVLAARYALAALALWAAEWLRRARPAGGSPSAVQHPVHAGRGRRRGGRAGLELALAGVVGYAGTTLLLFASFARIPTSLAILLLYTYPAWVALGGHLLGTEPFTRRRGEALLLALSGTGLVAGATWGGGPGWGAGVLLALGAALSNTVQMLLVDRALRAGLTPEGAARRAVAWGLAALLAVAAWTALGLPGAGGMRWTWSAGGPGGWTARTWAAALALGLLPTFLAVLALTRSLERIGPGRTALVSTTEPLFALVWGVLLLGERLSATQVLGAAVLLAGLAWLVRGEPEPGGSEAVDEAEGAGEAGSR
ncbi:MAG: DMT family transporter [Bacillota bacterium]|nr:DMT family transporter [Bacillota bacterium]